MVSRACDTQYIGTTVYRLSDISIYLLDNIGFLIVHVYYTIFKIGLPVLSSNAYLKLILKSVLKFLKSFFPQCKL